MPEKLNIPNGANLEALSAPIESPCPSDGGSSIYKGLNDYEYGQLPYSPVDELTGVPLILHPYGSSNDSHRFFPDKHHPWHPKNHPLVKSGTLGGEALRASRVQVASYDLHHLDYHRSFYGPELPVDDASRFNLIVLTAAGYIPERAVAFHSYGKPYTKKLSSELRLILWDKSKVRVDVPDTVRNFLKEYSFSQDLSDIKESVIEEFLFTKNRVKRWELGNLLLANGVHKATMPVREIYENAYKAELIPPARTKRVTKFVLESLNIDYQRDRLINELSRRLMQAAA